MAFMLRKGETAIGAFKRPDRVKPYIAVMKGNVCTMYGAFFDDERANEFILELADFVDEVSE